MTLSNPTRPRKPKTREPTAEDETWPEEAKILSIMQCGFAYNEAFHMSPRDARRFTALQQAWYVGDDRQEGVRTATAADVDLL